jgi:hypothetical protein
MLRNLGPAHGVCNNTRLVVEIAINSRLLQTVFAKLDRVVLIPRIDLKPKDAKFLFYYAVVSFAFARHMPLSITNHKDKHCGV